MKYFALIKTSVLCFLLLFSISLFGIDYDTPNDEKVELLNKYAPYISFHEEEDYFPSSVEFMFDNTNVVQINGENWLKTIENLDDTDQILEFFHGEDLLLDSIPVYAFWVEHEEYIELVYFTFFPYNYGKWDPLGLVRFGNHVGDWEVISVKLKRDNEEWIKTETYLSTHAYGSTMHAISEHSKIKNHRWPADGPFPWDDGSESPHFLFVNNNNHLSIMAHFEKIGWSTFEIDTTINQTESDGFISYTDRNVAVWRSSEDSLLRLSTMNDDYVWITEVIGSSPTTGEISYVPFDSRIYIYCGDASGELFVTYEDASFEWNEYEIGPSYMDGEISVIIHGGPYVFWRDHGDGFIRLTKFISDEDYEIVTIPYEMNGHGDIAAIRHEGHPFVFYTGTDDKLKLIRWDAGDNSWHNEGIGTNNIDVHLQVVLHEEEPYIIVRDLESNRIQITTYTGASNDTYGWVTYDDVTTIESKGSFSATKRDGDPYIDFIGIDGLPNSIEWSNTQWLNLSYYSVVSDQLEPINEDNIGEHVVAYCAYGSHGYYFNIAEYDYENPDLAIGLYVLSDITGNGDKWKTWDNIVNYNLNCESGLNGADWPLWMNKDFNNISSGSIKRWGNPKADVNIVADFPYAEYVEEIVNSLLDASTLVGEEHPLNDGPTGPIEKSIFLDSSDCNVINTSIDDVSSFDKDEKIYPNPTNSVLNIEFNSLQKLNNIRIFNLSGQAVLEKYYNGLKEKKVNLNLHDLMPGLYIVQVDKEAGVSRHQVIVTK